MRFLSVCSGIEAASVAWGPLGWHAEAFSEIDPFPSALLAHRFPHVPNWGGMTRFEEWPDAAIDLLVGGTPCQDYSVAGLRLGMAGSRGQLTLTFVEIAARYRPRYIVWENVPGVLSSNGGRDFARFLGDISGQALPVPDGGWQNSGVIPGIADAYGLAYRVLDAQYVRVDGLERAVPQRRRRVFVVGYLRDWRRAAAVLFERESLSGHPAPRREARQTVAPTLAGCSNGGGANGPGRSADDAESLIATNSGDVGYCLCANGQQSLDAETETLLAFDTTQITSAANRSNPRPGDPCHPLAARGHAPAVAFDARQSDVILYGDKAGPLDTDGHSQGIVSNWAVRRLMPVECERLQGFPDGWTDVPYRGKPAADGPRYKAIGNSMAVNCMRWIGRRIELVDAILEATA